MLGAQLSLIWVLPFAGLLLSIALFPVLRGAFWHRHHGKVAAFWALAFLIPFAALQGIAPAWGELIHVAADEYVPFILLLLALYTVSGGIWLSGPFGGTPLRNTATLAAGMVLASFAGTTGASVLLIRPLIETNRERSHNVHVFVFFILLVGNIGGALTPLGDPPLFLGFLLGVHFFWPIRNLLLPTAALSGILLFAFFLIDSYHARSEDKDHPSRRRPRWHIAGAWNFLLLAVIVGAVLVSGVWQPGIEVPVAGAKVPLQSLARDGILVLVAIVSFVVTPKAVHKANEFAWFPILEVAKLFAGLFVTIIPAIAILKAGSHGALGALIHLTSDAQGQPIESAYFWLTGGLSSILDNAPTYLIFFNMAGGDAGHLMGPLAGTLVAISAGAVFMGANTYLGNAPNFIVKSICEHRGVKMPSFFGYMLWPAVFLLPLFLAGSFVFFRL